MFRIRLHFYIFLRISGMFLKVRPKRLKYVPYRLLDSLLEEKYTV